MKRALLISFFLLFLFIIPSRVVAFSCGGLNAKYFLACEEGSCEGFKVIEEYMGGACQRLPYVVDLKKDESRQIHDFLYNVTEQINMNGSWLINMDRNCAYTLQNQKIDKFSQNIINNNCGVNGERIRVDHLVDSWTDESLQSFRDIEEKDARSTRLSFYFFQVLWIVCGLLLGGILPLLVILRYLKTRNKLFIPYVVLVLVAQIGIFIYLVLVTMTYYLDWASFNLTIITPLLFIEIGLMIGAKLENRYQKTRLQ